MVEIINKPIFGRSKGIESKVGTGLFESLSKRAISVEEDMTQRWDNNQKCFRLFWPDTLTFGLFKKREGLLRHEGEIISLSKRSNIKGIEVKEINKLEPKVYRVVTKQ